MILVLVLGLAIGGVYALVGIGFTLVYRTAGVINFAQGAFVMLGGMGTWYLYEEQDLGYVLSALLALLFCVVVAAGLWFAIVLPLRRTNAAPYIFMLATFVFAVLVGQLVEKAVSNQPRTLPPWFGGFTIDLYGVDVSGQYLVVIAVAAAVVGAVSLGLRHSKLGKEMRASAASPATSALIGVNPDRSGLLALLLGALLGGLAGILVTGVQFTSSDPLLYTVFGFAAAIAGGFGKIYGAVVGGMAFGIIQAAVSYYGSANYVTPVAFAVLILILTVRPQGLLGAEEHEAMRA